MHAPVAILVLCSLGLALHQCGGIFGVSCNRDPLWSVAAGARRSCYFDPLWSVAVVPALAASWFGDLWLSCGLATVVSQKPASPTPVDGE